MSSVKIKIDGMKCEGCMAAVHEKLSQVRGVSRVVVDLDRGEARVEIEDGKVSAGELVEAVREAGYGASLANMVEE